MSFVELLEQLEARLPGQILDGTPAETLAKARAGRHRDALAGQIVALLFDKSGAAGVGSVLERSAPTHKLSVLCLGFMKDDAPVAGLRLVENVVLAIDGAYNDEALAQKGEGKM
jgi:hypothetical protein